MPAHGLLSDSYELPKPKNWDIFEGIAQQLYGRVFGDPNPFRYGRGGQAQYGIDIHCRLNSDSSRLIGIQCIAHNVMSYRLTVCGMHTRERASV